MKPWHKIAAAAAAILLGTWLALHQPRSAHSSKLQLHGEKIVSRQLYAEKTLPPLPAANESNISTAFFEAYATGEADVETTLDRDGLHGYDIKFGDGVLMTISGASRASRTTAEYILQGKFADKFMGYEWMRGHYVELSNPHLNADLRANATSTTDVFPFSAENAVGLVNAQDDFGWTAFVWDKTRTRLAVLSTESSNPVEASKAGKRIWEIIASFKWPPVNTDSAPVAKPPEASRARVIPAGK